MIRALAVALATFVLLAIDAPSQAQPARICNGQFERLLQGFYINHTDMAGFFDDAPALAACRAQLDARTHEHRLIAAYILATRPDPSNAGVPQAQREMAALCREGSKVACYYALIYENIDLEMRARRLPPLVESGLPAAKTMLALLLAAGPEIGVVRDMSTADRLAREASGAGDYWASFYLARNLAIDMPADVAHLDRRWILRAADQGHIGAWVVHAVIVSQQGYPIPAEFALLSAATANPHLFRDDVAAAAYALGMNYRKRADAGGGSEMATEARRYLERAAALGHSDAKAELRKLHR